MPFVNLFDSLNILSQTIYFYQPKILQSKIPEEYLKKYGINNVRVYDLPFAWRLMYTITGSSEIGIISVILDWMDHKDYERLFKF